MSKLNRLSGFCNLKKFSCFRFRLFENSFGHLPSLQSLNLCQCDWSEFGVHWLDYLHGLIELGIDKPINFTHVDLGALVNLQRLYVYGFPYLNILKTVNKASLCYLEIWDSYKSLDINKVFSIIRQFKKLDNLNLKNFEFNDFDISTLLSGLTGIKCLSVDGCTIKKIKLNIDSLVSDPRIVKNQQPRNQEKPESESIAIFPRLEKLTLKNIFLASVYRHMFREMTNLTYLDLSWNRLEYLPDGVFAHLVNLVELLIAWNKLTRVSETTFGGLVQLRKLDLRYNPLRNFHPSVLSHAINLERVDLSGCAKLDNLDALKEVYKDKITL